MGRLSVVIPTHDTRELTLRCVASLAAAAPAEPMQIIVVDDASADGTAEALAAAHPAVEVLRLSPAAGFTRAANHGLARARGDVLLLLNSDTEVEPGGFAILLGAFDRDPRLGAAGAMLHYPDGSPQWSGGETPGLLWLFGLASGLPPLLARLPRWRQVKPVGAPPGDVAWVTGAALALRRRAWETVGPFDEGFRFYAQDLDLCLRLRAAGWDVRLLPDWSVLHHHGATIGRDPEVSGRRKGGGGHQHPELLWTDLLRWAQRHGGTAWGGRAAMALLAGAILRLLGRALLSPFVPDAERPARRAESRAFRRAARAVIARVAARFRGDISSG
jgi:GT2 family glycosyltransferase